MSTDSFSRALSGSRAFSSAELALLAETLQVPTYWLITGTDEPVTVVAAARHEYDRETGRRSLPGLTADLDVLNHIELAYRQAYGKSLVDLRETPDGTSSPADVLSVLGDGFVRDFIERIEEQLAIDVVRIAEIKHSYSLRIGHRTTIVVPASGNWFYENWCLAHELGHIYRGDLSSADGVADEAAANQFAAEILLPRDDIAGRDWDRPLSEVAERLWSWGVSTQALINRLDALHVDAPVSLRKALGLTTQAFLRRHWNQAVDETSLDLITGRMEQAAQRRFPRDLEQMHLERIARGAIGRGTLAWMLDVDAESLEVEAPVPTALRQADLSAALSG